MVKHTIIFCLCVGLAAPLPATKLELVPDELVQNETTKVEVGATHTGKVEVTLPYKVMSREELITWVTYAMRLMASKINITLADADPMQTPPEKIEKLRNSSEAINHFLEKVNNEEKKVEVVNKGKMKTVAMSSKHGPKCKHLEKQLEKLSSTSEKPTDNSANLQNQKYDFLNPPPVQQNNVEHFFSKMVSDSQKLYNPSLKLVQELALTNPYEHSDNKIFRDPHIFPPFNIQHQSSYLPLPVTPAYNEEKLKEFYAMANLRNHTNPSFAGVMDSLGGVQLVPMRTNFQHTLVHMPQMTRTEIDDLNSGSLAYKQQSQGMPHSPHRPVLSVPFEAFITITRESSTPVQPFTLTTSSAPPAQVSSSVKRSQKNRNKDRDNRHEASTNDVPDSLLPNRNRASKNGKNTSKTTIEFEDEVVTSKTVTEKKKKKSKKQTAKKPTSIFGTIMRMLTYTNKRNSTSTGLNIFGKKNKKSTNTKVLKGSMRGKRNETKLRTSKRQGDDEDDDDFNGNGDNNDDDENGNGNGDDTDNGNGNGGFDNERDIFDDDDDRFNDDYDYDEGGGSLGSLEDLIPLIIPILEDISDPESETDLVEFLQAAIPLLQGLSEPDPETGEGIDIVGVLLPILQNLSEGKDGMGSDSGAILGPLFQLIAPFIGPLSGPLIGPLSSSSSGGGGKGSNLGSLLSAILGPLSTPTEPGGQSPIAALTANIISILSKELSAPGSNVDIGGLVGQLVTGVLSGTSAGFSGGSSKHLSNSKDKEEGYGYGPDTGYGPPAAQQVEIFEPPPQTFPRMPSRVRQSSQKKKTSSSSTVIDRLRPESTQTQFRPQATHVELVELPQQIPIIPPAIIHKEQIAEPAHYGYGPPYGVPAHKASAFALLGKALKDILSSGVNLFTAVLGASTASAGASSQQSSGSSDSSHDDGYAYGPPPAQYGPPPPSKYGPPKPYRKPDSYQNIRVK